MEAFFLNKPTTQSGPKCRSRLEIFETDDTDKTATRNKFTSSCCAISKPRRTGPQIDKVDGPSSGDRNTRQSRYKHNKEMS
jgi:hypothetical protein